LLTLSSRSERPNLLQLFLGDHDCWLSFKPGLSFSQPKMRAALAAKSLIAGVRSKIAPPGSFAACSEALLFVGVLIASVQIILQPPCSYCAICSYEIEHKG
jgi:hypothetical protein